MNVRQQKIKGFTLLEILLVLAISSSLIVLMLNYTTQKSDETRRDKTVLQMQQILNAGLSYYVNTSAWPVKVVAAPNPACGTADSASLVTDMLTPNYIPQQQNYNNPYGNAYTLNCAPLPAGTFYVYTQANTVANAQIIAGRLPMGFVTDNTATTQYPPTQNSQCLSASPPSTCTYVVAFVNIPGQNLNNARSVNFAGTFSPSACVPAPVCPSGMKASIMVVPAGVSGVNDAPTCQGNTSPWNPDTNSNNCTANFYPVSSFTAYAVGGDAAGDPTTAGTPGAGGTGPYDCSVTVPLANKMPCLGSQGSDSFTKTNGAGSGSTLSSSYQYWRVCLAVVTTKGTVVINSGSSMAEWGKMSGSIVAFTRCVPQNGAESPIGSGYNVWQSNYNYNP